MHTLIESQIYLRTIDVSGFAQGMYFIELTDGAGNMRVEKFVRE